MYCTFVEWLTCSLGLSIASSSVIKRPAKFSRLSSALRATRPSSVLAGLGTWNLLNQERDQFIWSPPPLVFFFGPGKNMLIEMVKEVQRFQSKIEWRWNYFFWWTPTCSEVVGCTDKIKSEFIYNVFTFFQIFCYYFKSRDWAIEKVFKHWDTILRGTLTRRQIDIHYRLLA